MFVQVLLVSSAIDRIVGSSAKINLLWLLCPLNKSFLLPLIISGADPLPIGLTFASMAMATIKR